MKRLLLLFNLMLLGTFVFAQKAGQNVFLKPNLSEMGEVSSPSTQLMATPRAGAVIWSQDFSNGIPASWNNVGNPSGANWEYRGPNTVPSVDTGSRGAWTSYDPIQSPTRANGFVIYDSDYYDNAGSRTGAGTGPYPAPHEGSLISPVIDLSNNQFVRLQWYQYYRQFNSFFLVLLSTDGGLTFPDTIWNNETLNFYNFVDVNVASATDRLATVDISNLAGGEPDVVIQWKFAADPAAGANAGYYFWMIDDVAIVDKPSNDLSIEGRGIIEINNVGLFYGHIPAHYFDNVQGNPIGINTGVFVKNAGINNQTNTTLTVNTTGYNQSTTPVTIARDSTRLLSPVTPFMPTALGRYDLVFTVTSDSTDEFTPDNTVTRTIYITDSTLALDANVRSSYLGTNSFTTSGSESLMRMANWVEVQEKDTALSVTIGLSPASRVGGAIKVQIRDTASTIVSNTVLMESDLYELTAADTIATYVTIPFLESFDRELPANDYIVVAELYAGGSNQQLTVRVADDRSVEQPWYASTIQLPSSANTWYSNGNAFHIRLNVMNPAPDTGTGIVNVKTLEHKLYPNPTKGEANVTYSLVEASDVSISIKDISGKTVMNLNEERQGAGNYNRTLDLRSLPNGIYIYELKVNEESFINKLVINR